MTYDDQFDGAESDKDWNTSDSNAKDIKVPETISEGEYDDPKGEETEIKIISSDLRI